MMDLEEAFRIEVDHARRIKNEPAMKERIVLLSPNGEAVLPLVVEAIDRLHKRLVRKSQ